MQSRELPRVMVAETPPREPIPDDEPPPRSRFARLDFVRAPRRFDWFRLALTCLLVGAMVWVAGYCGQWAVHNAVDWLHAQPRYQLAFENIELSPHAPDWIRGGDRTVLREVLKKSGLNPVLSIPSLDKDLLTSAFRDRSPWVSQVRGIRFSYPNRVVVELGFRKPVATIKISSGRLVVLDEDGVILPDHEIDSDRVSLTKPATGEEDSLILIGRMTITDPKDRSPGVTWRSNPIDVEATEADRRIIAAAKLAGFFRSKDRGPDPKSDAIRIYEIHINEPDKQPRLVVFNFELARILWGFAPGEEPPGSLTAEQKWAMLRDWAQLQPRPAPPRENEYWMFQKDGLTLIPSSSSRPD